MKNILVTDELGIIKALDIKQWQLSNVIKLRTADMEDATL